MSWLRVMWARVRGLFGQRSRDEELDEEMRTHLEMLADEHLRQGLTPAEAHYAARRSFGGVTQAQESYRDQRGLPLIAAFGQDLHYTVRQLQRSPGFAVTAVLILALGMGASVAIFGLADAALLKPLPYQDPSRLVGVFESVATFSHANLSYLDYLDWKKRNNVFRSLDVYQHSGFTLSSPAGAQPVRGTRVTDGFFRTLGVSPVWGRDFFAGEDLPGAPRTVLLSYAAWQSRYSGKRDVIGRTVTLDGAPHTIIGVLPREFHFAPAEPAEFWTAFHASSSCDLHRSCHAMYGVARLKEGVSIPMARANLQAIAKLLEQQYPASNRDQGASVAPLTEVIVGDVRPILLVLLGGAMLLLLIANVNVASLLLVRSESRRREIALRSALGASAARIVSQFVTEGVVLVAAGSVLGLASAYEGMQLLIKLIPAPMLAAMPYLHDAGLNVRVLAFAGIVALLATVLFALTPALRLPLLRVRQGLSEGSRGSTGNTWRRLGGKLVVVELATAMVLLVGAGLLGQSLYRLLQVDIGLRSDHLATLDVVAPQSGYGKDEQAISLERQVVNRVASLPGVKSVGITTLLPVSHNGNTTWFRVVGRPHHGEHNEVPQREVGATYFRTVGAKLRSGRYFTDAEDVSKPRVVIVNQKMARQYFPGEDPIGKQITRLSDPPAPMEIVGVIEDIREGPLDIAIPPVLYIPFDQSPDRGFAVVVRTAQAEQALLATLAATIRQIDPGIVVLSGKTMSERINDSPSAYLHRSAAWLVGGFAAVALLLGVVGVYGVIAYSVSQRRREIGVRLALGAQRRAVYRLILSEAGWLTALGIAIGTLCSLATATLLGNLLFGVRSWDVPTLVAVAAVLGTAALLASYLPARRAASVNPVEVLRAE